MQFKVWIESLSDSLISDYEKQLAYILKTGKIPPNINTFMTNSSDYYDHIHKKLQELKENPDSTFYHGSNSIIEKFDFAHIGTGTGVYQEGPGFYFTSDPEDAKKYGKYVKKYLLHMNKLVSLTGRVPVSQIRKLIDAAPNLSETLTNFDEDPIKAKNMALNMIIQNTPFQAFLSVWGDFYMREENGDALYLRNMIKFKYDGVLIPRNNLNHVIVFNPSKIQEIQ